MKNITIDNNTGANQFEEKSNNPLQHLKASSIIGEHVFGSQGEALGQIMDIMIDITDGRIDYVVIEFGGFLGMNQKYFAVPFNVLSLAGGHDHKFVMNETRESLKQKPGFDKNHWPETNAPVKPSRFSNSSGFMGVNTGAEY